MKLLGTQNAKTVKGETAGYLTGIVYLAPSDSSSALGNPAARWNTCAMASKGCRAACLYTAGRGRMPNVSAARLRKTARFFEDREGFMADLVDDIRALKRKAAKLDLTPAVRLNGTSDLRWERFPLVVDGEHFANIMAVFPDVQFYDYTKIPGRHGRFGFPANYHLTFSRSESNQDAVEAEAAAGRNIAVVFAGDLPESYLGRPVVSGDETDLRFLDPDGCVVGLTAKGKARKDTSGFVVQAGTADLGMAA